jgi:acylphosphatase
MTAVGGRASFSTSRKRFHMARLHVWVEGLVQGVFFRDSTRRAAVQLGLAGWVRNLPNGSVEAVFEGERAACEKALQYVKVGPSAARVTAVKEIWDEEEEGLGRFRIV